MNTVRVLSGMRLLRIVFTLPCNAYTAGPSKKVVAIQIGTPPHTSTHTELYRLEIYWIASHINYQQKPCSQHDLSGERPPEKKSPIFLYSWE